VTAELALEKRLRLAVNAAGGHCIKLPANLYRGIPDRLVLLPLGRVFFIELKREHAQTTRRVAPNQSVWAEYLLKYGFNFVRISGNDQLKEFVHEHIGNPV